MSHQPWHLTALALGELPERQAMALRQKIQNDPQLAQEFHQIQSTVVHLQQHWSPSPTEQPQSAGDPSGLDAGRREALFKHFAVSTESAPESVHNAACPPLSLAGAEHRLRWQRNLAFFAAAACLAVAALGLALPGYFADRDRALATAPKAAKLDQPAANLESEVAESVTTRVIQPGAPSFAVLAEGTKHMEDMETSLAGTGPAQPSTPLAGLPARSQAGGTGASQPAPASKDKPIADMYGIGMGMGMGGDAGYGSAMPGGLSGGVDLGGYGGGKGGGKDGRPMSQGQGGAGRNWQTETFGEVSREKARARAGENGQRDEEPFSAPTPRLVPREALTKRRLDGLAQDRMSVEMKIVEHADALGELDAPSSDLVAEVAAVTQGDRFARIQDNSFVSVRSQPQSTFSIDVDTASFTKVRQSLLDYNSLPRPDAVRIEELLNYFAYGYEAPKDDAPFAAHLAVAQCPWASDHRLLRVALQGKKPPEARLPSNLVFLLDVSGSMNEANKLPLVKETMRLLIERLTENDRVAMVVYAGAAGLVLPSTTGNRQQEILQALDRLSAGGSTNGGQGIQLAYQIARQNYIPGGINRVLLCTDGDFNVGLTGTDALVGMVEQEAKSRVFLTVLGFGMGNTNDEMMEQITNRGNGFYGFVDSPLEARRLMVDRLAGTLETIAKDVKIQIEFNPARISAYRLIGYENRILAAEDFADDKKDAGEIGMGHSVTALYEIIPVQPELARKSSEVRQPEPLRYLRESQLTPQADSDELMVLKLRSKPPEGAQSRLQEFTLKDASATLKDCDRDFRWAAAICQFGMMLRGSPHAGQSTWPALMEMAEEAAGSDPDVYRQTALAMMRKAQELLGQK